MRMNSELPIKKNACKEALNIRERKIINGINETIAEGLFFYSIHSAYMTDDLLKRLKAYGYKVEEKMNYRHDYIYTISWLPEEKEEDSE